MGEWAVRLDWQAELTEELAEQLAEQLEGIHGIPGRVSDGVTAVRVTVEARDAREAETVAYRRLFGVLRVWVGIQRIEVVPLAEFLESEALALDGAMVS
ncbi:hypothetical protein [Microbispora sp. NPDC049633]|uniref:hypothetical protein n=1 Tax=Microbispora sp. NPDC049633 TaxID=3154355 RepID=UPI003446BDF2